MTSNPPQQFFGLGLPSSSRRRTPWIMRFNGSSGGGDATCPLCSTTYPFDRADYVVAELSERHGHPREADVIGAGGVPLLTVSGRVLDMLSDLGQAAPATPVRFAGDRVPEEPYFALKGHLMRGCTIDLPQSGFVGAKECPRCGFVFMNDIAATTDRQESECPALVIKSWEGADLFTSAASAYEFIGTARFVHACHERGIKGVQFRATKHFWDYRSERSAADVVREIAPNRPGQASP